jgi:hypothetical protein
MSPHGFDEDPDLGVITASVVLGGAPILMVSHDEDDGGWQFLCGTTSDPDDGRVVHLDHIVAMDPTVTELVDLPLGWVAHRASRDEGWTREPNPRRSPFAVRWLRRVVDRLRGRGRGRR